MRLKYALFDLDGTLTDPAVGITNCVMYALDKFAVHPVSREELYPYIGPPLKDSFMEFHGLTPEQAEQAVAYYRDRFSVTGLYENELLEGISCLLKELKERGVVLMVATSKPEEFTHRILSHFRLADYFTFVAGSTLSGLRSTKAEVIGFVRENYADMDAENTLMIGDRKFDVEGAHEQGLPAVGVLYGYGDRAEMEAAEADFIVTDVADLRELLLTMV